MQISNFFGFRNVNNNYEVKKDAKSLKELDLKLDDI